MNDTGKGDHDVDQPRRGGERPAVKVGGGRPRACYALLDGVHEDPESGGQERVTISITQLPAVLGRSHDTADPHFFGLGKKKALSRKHCTVYYRDAEGGRVEYSDNAGRLTYEADAEKEFAEERLKPNRPGRGGDSDASDDEDNDGGGGGRTRLPPRGFFVIENISKNRIMVDKERVEQGESIVLRSGSAVRISSYMLYFLLPTDAKPTQHVIPAPSSSDAAGGGGGGGTSSTGTDQNKRKGPMGITAPAHSPSLAGSAAAAAATAATSSKRHKAGMGPNFQYELESMPVDELIGMMDQAVRDGLWERRHQLIGSTIAVHAVRSAAESPELRGSASRGGVARSEIMGWISGSARYGGWVRQMLQKMEPRSYQASITKSLLKAGFERTSGAGRYVKWELPAGAKAGPSRGAAGRGARVPEEFDSDDEPLSKTKTSAERKDKRVEGGQKSAKGIKKEEDVADDDDDDDGDDVDDDDEGGEYEKEEEDDDEVGTTGTGKENEEEDEEEDVIDDENDGVQDSNGEDGMEEEEDVDDDDDDDDE